MQDATRRNLEELRGAAVRLSGSQLDGSREGSWEAGLVEQARENGYVLVGVEELAALRRTLYRPVGGRV